MKSSKRLPLLFAAILFVLGLGLIPQQASAAALSGTWSCGAYANCAFFRTSSNHATYQWNFGDGNFSGLTTNTITYHNYDIPYSVTPVNFTVYFLGYPTSGGGSPDNIVSCTITTYRTSIGGDPTTYSGNCN